MNLFQKNQPAIDEGLQQAAKTPGTVVIDVRSREEYAGGHIPGSSNVPLNELPAANLDPEKPLFLYCHSGARSKRASQWLQQRGYRVTNLGGITGYRGTLKTGDEP